MSVLANNVPAVAMGRQPLLVIILETLIARFPSTMNPTPGAFDTEEQLLYKIALTVGNIPSTGGAANYSGSGAPSVAAAEGSTYTDTNGPAFYYKAGGGVTALGWQIGVG